MTIRVLVADDQPLMRAAFEMTLRSEDDIELVSYDEVRFSDDDDDIDLDDLGMGTRHSYSDVADE